jgi:FkbM family methyltransferase
MKMKFLSYSYYHSFFTFRKRQINKFLYNLKLLRKFPSSERSQAKLLISSLKNPYGEREQLVKDYFQEKGTTNVVLRHSFFNYFRLSYDLSDNYQMAIVSEFLIENVYNFSKLKFVPKNVIDCGGYKGFFTWLALNKFKKSSFICVEPHPQNYLSILEVVKENNLSNIEVVQKAISKSTQPIKLCINGTLSSLYSENGIIIEVEALGLNQIIENKDELLLKVDIEGSELEFFPEIIYSLPKRCAIYLETHDSWESLSKIKKTFLENGFEFQVMRERGLYIDSFAQRI